jgi:hypothetical protein
MTTRSLFTIADDLLALAALLTETDGDLTDPTAEAAVDAWFAELDSERDAKIDDYCAMIRELEGRAQLRTQEARRLMAHAQVDERTVDRLRARLYAFCKEQGLTRLVTRRFHLGIVSNGGLCPLGHTQPPEAIPPAFQKVSVDYDNVAIRKALDAGEALTFALYLPRGERLSIR